MADDNDDADTVDDALAFVEEEEDAAAAEAFAAKQAEAEAEAAAAKKAAEAAAAAAPTQVQKQDPPSQHEDEFEEEVIEEEEMTDGYEEEEVLLEDEDGEFIEEEVVQTDVEEVTVDEEPSSSQRSQSENEAVVEEISDASPAAGVETSPTSQKQGDSGAEGTLDKAAPQQPSNDPDGAVNKTVGEVTDVVVNDQPAEASDPDPSPAPTTAAVAATTAVTEPPPQSPVKTAPGTVDYKPPSPPPPIATSPTPSSPRLIDRPKHYVDMPPSPEKMPNSAAVAAAAIRPRDESPPPQEEEELLTASPLPSPRSRSSADRGGRAHPTSIWMEDEPTDEMGMRMNELPVEVMPRVPAMEEVREEEGMDYEHEEEKVPEEGYLDEQGYHPSDEGTYEDVEQDYHGEEGFVDQEEQYEQEVDDDEEYLEEEEYEQEVVEEDHDGNDNGQYIYDEPEDRAAAAAAAAAAATHGAPEQYMPAPPGTGYSNAKEAAIAGDVEAGQKKRQEKEEDSSIIKVLGGIICCIVILVAIVVGVVLSRNNDEPADRGGVQPNPPTVPTVAPAPETWAPTGFPSLAPTPGPISLVEVQRFAGSTADPGFGSAVTFMGDWLAIGAALDGSPGSVNIYEKTAPIVRHTRGRSLQDYFGNTYAPSARLVLAATELEAEFGSSIDLAINPETTNLDDSGIVVGAPGAYIPGLTVNAGAAYFYRYDLASGGWIRHGSAIRGGSELTNSNERFGASVATSFNRNVVVGAPGNNGSGVRAGRVYIYEYQQIPGGTSTQLDWIEMMSEEPLRGQSEDALFGASVDINQAGDMIVIGEPGSQSFTVLDRTDSGWKVSFQLPRRRVGGSLGSAVKILSADYIAVGADAAKQNSGSVRIYTKSAPGVWEEYGPLVYGELGDRIGSHGAMDGALGPDGPEIVVGTATGSVKRFDLVADEWFVRLETEPGSAVSAIAYSPDAEILAGRSKDNSVRFYEVGEGPPPTSPDVVETQPPQTETAVPGTAPPGTAVPGTEPPETAVPGTPPPETAVPGTTPPGTTLAPTPIVPEATLAPTTAVPATSAWQVTHGPLSLPQANTGYGKSVDLGNNLFVSGLPSLFTGAVQTSIRANGEWAVLDDALSEENSSQFGASLDLRTGATPTSLLVGAPKSDDLLFGLEFGAAFFYQLSGGNAWTRLGGAIRPGTTPPETQGEFGAAVASAASTLRVCIGAPASNIAEGGGTRSAVGRVYTYGYNAGAGDWEQVADQLVGANPNDRLGASIDMSADGTRLVVGSPGSGGTANGNVAYYEWTGSSWTQVFSVAGTASESFGTSVAIIAGNRFAAGGPSFAGSAGVVRVYSQVLGTVTQLGSDIVGSLGDKLGTTLSGGSSGRVVVGSSQGSFHAYDFDTTLQDWVEVDIGPKTDSAVSAISTVGDATSVLVGTNAEEVSLYDLL